MKSAMLAWRRPTLPTLQRWHWVALALIAFGVMAVTSSYTRLSETDDELFHVRCGMEWWRDGTYTTQALHPPLARVMDASLLYLTEWVRGKALHDGMHPRDAYMLRMVLTRLGSLPFYLFSCWLILRWGRLVFGRGSALCALGLYVSLSSVTAHASFATTDIGYTAMLLWAQLAFVVWLRSPQGKESFWLGASFAAALGTKYSTLLHLPLSVAVILLLDFYDRYRKGRELGSLSRQHFRQAILTAMPSFIIILWLIFHCDFAPLFKGVAEAIRLNSHAYGVWFYGPLGNKASWAFFPVVFFFKTPLTFHALSMLSALRTLPAWYRGKGNAQRIVPLCMAITLLAASTTSNINLGVRHVLPLYPLLCLSAGHAMWLLWHWQKMRWKLWVRSFACIVAFCHAVSFCSGHPEHLAYFNVLAGEHPERITLDSDFDWGQSVVMLDEELQRRDIKAFHLCARRDAVWSAQFIVKAKKLPCPVSEVTGWVAVSRAQRLLNHNISTWLRGYEAVEPIGKTMDLYYFAPSEKKVEPSP